MDNPAVKYTLFLMALAVSARSQPLHGADEVDIIYDSSEERSRETVIDAGVFGIFDNPALASGLANGAEALNNSVTTLMDSIFYDLLDNDEPQGYRNLAQLPIGGKL